MNNRWYRGLFVGIDPSMNSTGICVQVYDFNIKDFIYKFFYIIKNGKLTKKEKEAEQKNLDKFGYILVDRIKDSTISNNEQELNKLSYFNDVTDAIKEIIKKTCILYNCDICYVCLEGISYGSSIKTRSIFDLTGLNYLIRYKLYNKSFGYVNELYIGTPQEIKKFSVGMGNANKDLLIQTFKAIYPEFDLPKIDDIVDAYFMSTYAKHIYDTTNGPLM
jgi:Holliday junction resolvasome RuvABC endonuclease subunit